MARDIIIDNAVYPGVSKVSLVKQGGGTAQFLFVDGAPGQVPHGAADVVIDGESYGSVGVVALKDQEGEQVFFVLADGGQTVSYPVYPGQTIAAGGLVTVVPGLMPATDLYPSASLYPSDQEMVRVFTDGQPDGIAVEGGSGGDIIQIYVLG